MRKTTASEISRAVAPLPRGVLSCNFSNSETGACGEGRVSPGAIPLTRMPGASPIASGSTSPARAVFDAVYER